MSQQVDTAIVGAGSAGLSALRQVKKSAESYVLIDPGPLGTTCARAGCMPSKALIHVANAYHRRHAFKQLGIRGASRLRCEIPDVLQHVRTLRDHFTAGMVEATHHLAGTQYWQGKGVLEGPQHIRVGKEVIHARRIVLVPGASPVVPKPWRAFGDRILTSSTIFEQEDLPPRIAVIGLGAIGLELGQALARLGVAVTGFDRADMIGGLSDPMVNAATLELLRQELALHLGVSAEIREVEDGLEVSGGGQKVVVDKILAAVGVKPNIEGLGLETLNVDLDDQGMPSIDPLTAQIADQPVYLAGDANGIRPILHEALDEGFIAGRSGGKADDRECSCRRTPLRIVFSDPQCAGVGTEFAALDKQATVIGKADFTDQSRAVLEGSNRGLLRVYAAASSGRLLGAEMGVPDGEHLGHLLALAIQEEQTVFDLLRMPFYHPTTTEGVRTALRDAAHQLDGPGRRSELSLCESCPEAPLR
ncbi:MAG: dihydrolipoyl dehydrogenase [Kiritimatiellia bacterium]|nr:dihydrolipoyl dehydrogenase [Kiritimatiellia bacterium]